jgi:hypothetical protein
MTKNAQRLSQVVSTFGPGAMVDLPHAQTLPREAWAASTVRVDLSPVKNVVAVHRLREVSCLYGFTRFEAAPTSADGDLEDIQLAVRGAPLLSTLPVGILSRLFRNVHHHCF